MMQFSSSNRKKPFPHRSGTPGTVSVERLNSTYKKNYSTLLQTIVEMALVANETKWPHNYLAVMGCKRARPK